MKWRKMIYLKIARMSRGSNTPVPSIISFGTKIKGHILGGDVIHIDGHLEGNIICEELIIGSRGHVYGQVKTKNISIYGLLQGSAEAQDVIVAKSARVSGDITYSSIAIEPGAQIEGRCIKAAKEDKVSTLQPELKPVATTKNKASA
ncbi:MAG: polymer-forming cytoskeletal protein [Alphaproteobacteria bacterium]|nr:polymer-forming cytoskeletal protein [Alphaproteobacteria bacterium]